MNVFSIALDPARSIRPDAGGQSPLSSTDFV